MSNVYTLYECVCESVHGCVYVCVTISESYTMDTNLVVAMEIV